jgi:hypothetical protein
MNIIARKKKPSPWRNQFTPWKASSYAQTLIARKLTAEAQI